MIGHQDCQKMHAKRRLKERYGISMNRETLNKRVADQLDQAPETDSDKRGTVYLVVIKDQPVKVVWNHKTGNIVTCLPLN